MLSALEKLVRIESPTEDLAACREVMDCASQIAHELLGAPAQIQEVNGRPVFLVGFTHSRSNSACTFGYSLAERIFPTFMERYR